MKFIRNNILLFVCLFFLIIFLSPLFHGFYISHDGENHVARFAAYYTAFTDGQLPPRWAGSLNYHYGSPLLIFFYPLPGYIAVLLHIMHLSFEQCYLVLMSLCFLAAPAAFYLWSKTFLKKEQAITASFLYGLAPYHFLDLFVRGDVGEMLAFVFVPLVFLSIDRIIKEKTWTSFFWGSAVFGFLIMSHNGMSLLFTPVMAGYACFSIFVSKQWKMMIPILLLFLLGLSFSAFFWAPALFEKKYVHASYFIGDMYKYSFPSLTQLIFSSWGFGSEVNKTGGLSPQIGVVIIAGAVAGVASWVRAKKKELLLLYWVFIFLTGIFFTLSVSGFFWSHLSLLPLLEFPWRFTALTSFSAVMLTIPFLQKLKGRYLLFLSIIFLVSCFPFITVKGYTSRSDRYYMQFPRTTYFHGEASTIWTAGDPWRYPPSPVEVIEGKGMITDIKEKSQQHEYVVNMVTDGKILDNTIYFPGWRVYVDGKFENNEFQDILRRGFITFTVPKGGHTILVIFKETYIRLFADAVSLLAFVIILFGIILSKLLLVRSKNE